MVTRILRGRGKLLKEGKYLCDTGYELINQKPRGPGRVDVKGYLSGFDQRPLLGLAGEILVLRLSEGGEQDILLLEDIYQKPRWRSRTLFPGRKRVSGLPPDVEKEVRELISAGSGDHEGGRGRRRRPEKALRRTLKDYRRGPGMRSRIPPKLRGRGVQKRNDYDPAPPDLAAFAALLGACQYSLCIIVVEAVKASSRDE